MTALGDLDRVRIGDLRIWEALHGAGP